MRVADPSLPLCANPAPNLCAVLLRRAQCSEQNQMPLVYLLCCYRTSAPMDASDSSGHRGPRESDQVMRMAWNNHARRIKLRIAVQSRPLAPRKPNLLRHGRSSFSLGRLASERTRPSCKAGCCNSPPAARHGRAGGGKGWPACASAAAKRCNPENMWAPLSAVCLPQARVAHDVRTRPRGQVWTRVVVRLKRPVATLASSQR